MTEQPITDNQALDPDNLHPQVPKTFREKFLQVNIPYEPERQKRLFRFCGAVGIPVARFTAEALDNEIEARMDSLSPEARDALEVVLKLYLTPPKKG